MHRYVVCLFSNLIFVRRFPRPKTNCYCQFQNTCNDMKSNRGEFEWIVKPDPDNDNGLVPMKAIDMKKQLSIHKQMFYLFFILSMVRRVLLRIAQTMLKWIRNERKKCTIRNAKIHLLFNAAWGLIWVGTKGYLWEKYHIKQSTFKSKQSNNYFMGAKK